MRTDLIYLEEIPTPAELSSLVGEDIYNYHQQICEAIISQLSPNLEKWDNGSRRGKYYHGYRMEKKAITIDMFFVSNANSKRLTCEFHFRKRMFEKILKQKQLFSMIGQEAINSCIELYKQYPSGYYLDFRLNNDKSVFDDIMLTIKIISGNKSSTKD